MTIASQTSRISYTGDGVTTAFAVPFFFSANSDLVVSFQDLSGTVTTKLLGTDYNLSGATVSTGGTCTFVVAPTTGFLIAITRVPPITQTTSYNNNDPFPAKSHENALDKATTIDQYLKSLIDRAILVAPTDTPPMTTLPPASVRALKALSFDASGNPSVTTPVTGTAVSSAMIPVVAASTLAIARTALGVEATSDFATRALAIAATIDATVQAIRIAGYTTAGDGGGANYVRVVSLTAGMLGFQSADGAWWQISERVISIRMAGAVGDGVTNDTAAIQAAIDSTPLFGELYIPPTADLSSFIIREGATPGVALVVNRPINIRGGGNLSRLRTHTSMGTTIGGIHVLQGGRSWKGIVWEGFTLGVDTNAVPFARFGSYGIYFDATTVVGGFQGINIRNLNLGESAGFYALWIDGVGTQGNRIDNNFIWGGIFIDATADSQLITNNRISGQSQFGVRINTPGAGQSMFTGNSMTAAGGLTILSGSWPIIQNNYFEEVYTPIYARNAFIDIGGASASTVVGAQIQGNIIANIVSTTTLGILIGTNASGTMFANNFIANLNARTAVNTFGTGSIQGPNVWQTSATHVGGTEVPTVYGGG